MYIRSQLTRWLLVVGAILVLTLPAQAWRNNHDEDAPPVISGQEKLTTSKNTPITIAFDDLIVEDPDSSYPAGFSLTLFGGNNYTFTDQTVTPAPAFTGLLIVPVVVNDGVDDSNTFNLQISVAKKQNIAPSITGQAALTTDQAQPITIEFADLTVTDPDNPYPTGFTMTLMAGTGYTITGNTVNPASDFTGTLSVPVVVNDGTDDSNTFSLQITVNAAAPVNTAPTITGQQTLSTEEDQPITINLSDLTVTDPDNVYPTGFTLTLSAGANYTVNSNVITPAPGFTGTLSVPTVVNDGTDNSNTFSLQISVTPKPVINTPPTITGQAALSTQEGQAITIQFSHLTVTDPDNTYPTGFTLTLSAGANYAVANNVVTPAAGFTGTLSVPTIVNDGTDNSNTFSLQIAVTEKPNVAPTITGQTALTTQEDQPITIGLQHLTVTDPDDSYPTGFTMTLSSGPNYSINDKTITPTAGFTGTLSIPTVVNDGTENSNTFQLQITVTPKPAENVKPSIAGQVELSMLNNQTLTIELANLIVTDPDDSYPGDFTLKVSPGDNYTVVNHTITPATGFTGILTVNVIVNDGHSDSAPFPLKITVSPANTNQKPVITGQQELSTFMGTPITISLSHLLVTDPDNTYPTGFTLAIEPGANYTVSGTTITPAAGFTGTLTVGVSVNDGTAQSETFSLRVGVIDKGTLQITGQTPVIVREDSVVTLALTNLQVNDPDKKYPAGFSIQIQPGQNYTASGATVSPAPNVSGNLSVPVTVTDGARTSNVFNVVVTVIAVNDAPAFTSFDGSAIAATGNSPVYIAKEITIEDVDNESLVFAEVSIDAEDFISGKEELIAQPTGSIQSVFDPNTGILILIGQGSLADYESVLGTVQYHFKSDTLPALTTKHIHFKLNDGIVSSEIKTKTISLEEMVKLDIPNVFTPNGDDANDTWKISNTKSDDITAMVRVFDKRGLMVYESSTLTPWDGRYQGQVVAADTYFYVIEVDSGFRKISKKGVVLVAK
jgi:gliding motility-associated-like protein